MFFRWYRREKHLAQAPLEIRKSRFSVACAPARQQSTISKEIWYSIDPRNFGCDVSVRPSVRPYRLWGSGRGFARQPDGGWRMLSFLGAKSRGAFGQPAFFLAGNRMSTVNFEKEVF